jgi:hypothetical protein
MLRGKDHFLSSDAIHNIKRKVFDKLWDRFMRTPRSDAEILVFKEKMKNRFNSLYTEALPATENYIERQARLGYLPRASKMLVGLGIVGGLFGAAASAQAMGGYLQDYACDKMQGKDDWAYVDALMVRQELNQHGLFAGDVAMRGMLR